MQKALTLSLVIPVYNEEYHLKTCLDAVAAQAVLPDEIIVVDNNSQDHTVSIAQGYKNVRIVSESRQGVLCASRTGYDAAQGDIICRIDADTVMPPEWTQHVQRFFSQNPEVAAVTGNCYFYDFPFRRAFRVVHHAVYYSVQKLIAGTEVLWGSNMAIRNSAWQTVRAECLTKPTIHEDIDLSLHLQDHRLKIRRSSALFVGVSMRLLGVSTRHGVVDRRHGNFSPKIILTYLWPWPQTYWLNKHHLRALLITLILVFIFLITLPPTSLLWLYQATTQKVKK